jgi:MFS family permease
MGLVQGLALFVFAGIAGVGIGWAVDRAPRLRHWFLFAGIIVWSIATAACGLAHSFGDLFGARTMIGFGEASLGPTFVIILSTRFPRGRNSLANGLYTLGSGISALITYPLGGLLIRSLTQAGGFTFPVLGHLKAWQATFVFFGLPGFVLAFLAFALKDRPEDIARRAERAARAASVKPQTVRGFLAKRGVLLAHQIVAYGAMTMTSYALIAWTPAHLERNFHLDPAQAGLVMGGSYGAIGALAQIVSGLNIDRLYRRGVNDAPYRYFTITTLIGIPLVIFTFTTTHVALCIAGICLIWLIMQGLGPLIAPIQLFTPLELRARIGMFSTLITSTVSIGATPFLIGLMNDYVFHDKTKVGWSIAIFITLMGLIGVAAMTSGRRHLARAISEDYPEAPVVAEPVTG